MKNIFLPTVHVDGISITLLQTGNMYCVMDYQTLLLVFLWSLQSDSDDCVSAPYKQPTCTQP